MFKNYFKTAWRNFLRHKTFSVINVAGLAIGMTCSIFILLWVQNEKNYDRFHKNSNNIYRVTCAITGLNAAIVPGVMLPELKRELPMIENMTRISFPQKQVMEVGSKKFLEEKAYYVDSTFLQMFSFSLIEGDPGKALMRPDAILLTKDVAKKYFGSDMAIGKIVKVNNNRSAIVTGVLENVPANSHLQFDFIMPLSAIAQTNNDLKYGDWHNFAFYGYLQLEQNFQPSAAAIKGLERQLNDIYKTHVPKEEMTAAFHLQPIADIHLGANYQGDLPGHGNALYVKIFFLVAMLILAVACINFMNLATARSADRAKEVGLRKTVGAGRRQLILQFLSESLLISFLSLFTAGLLVWLLLPFFNELAGKQMIIQFFDWKTLLLLIGIALITGLLSGSYPALFLSSFNPVKVLKGEIQKARPVFTFRNLLVIIQFITSIVLMVGALVVYRQLTFIKNMNLGFEKSNLIYMPMMGDLGNQKEAFKIMLQKNNLTSDFTIAGELPTDILDASDDVKWAGMDLNHPVMFSHTATDDAFFDVFGMKIINGRTFLKDSKADSSNYIINEKAAKAMGMTAQSAVGKTISQWGIKGAIVGVVKDFNFKPVQQTIGPLIIRYNRGAGMMIVRAKPGMTVATVKELEKINKILDPSTPFSFGFVDQDLANLYKGEQQMGRLFNIFTIIGLFISCLGLYGLSTFLAEQRKKEVGVRKVLGASVSSLVYLLSLNFTKLVLIAIAIAIPVSWLGVNRWLSGFAYRINVGWDVFFIAAFAALLIAWVTVSLESIKAAIANPVKALRSE